MRNYCRGRVRSGSLTALGLILWFLPTRLEAHAAIKGMGEFVSGFLHPLLTPLHLLVLLSLGLLMGQRRPLDLERPMAGFAGFAAVGLLTTAVGINAGASPAILIVIGLCAGSLVALAMPLPTWARVLACAAAGLALGLDSGMDPGATGAATAKTLCATWISLSLCVADVAFYSSRLPKYQWVQTGIRVAGSWIVAIGMLMLAFALRR